MRRCGFAIAIALGACHSIGDLEQPVPFLPSSAGTATPPTPRSNDAGPPVPIVTVEAIAVNRDQSCATLTASPLSVCWSAAKPPASAADFIQLSIRFDEAVGNGDWFLGRTASSSYVWGSGALGEDGNPDASAAGSALVFGPRGKFGYRTLGGAAGTRHGCAVSSSHDLFCWGDDAFCQVSAGAACTAQLRGMTDLSEILGPNAFFTSVAAGAAHTCGIGATGAGVTANVYCWGGNANGETGQPVEATTTPAALPLVPPVKTNGLAVASGDHHACANVAGDLYCWGKNDKHQASPTEDALVIAPTKVDLAPDIVGKVAQLALGGDRTCFVVRPLVGKQPSRAFCFGDGRIREVPAIEGIAQLAVSDTHACAIAHLQGSPTNATEIYCWSGDDVPERVNGLTPR